MAALGPAVCDPSITRPPYVVRWDEPVPVQAVRRVGKPVALGPTDGAPPWLPTGPEGKPFDFCAHVRRLADDVVRRCPQLAHVRTDQVLFAFTQARNGRRS